MNGQDKAASRRNVLRAGVTAFATGVAATSLLGSAKAQDKLAKEAVQYQDKPKDGAKCSACVNYIEPKACQIVAGEIDPEGWCIAFGPKSS